MAKKQFQQYLSRRVMSPDGWTFFCRICGNYLPETEFYKSKQSDWGIDTKCKLHYTKKDKDDDGEMDYLKLGPLKEKDFIDAQKLLTSMGYEFGTDKTIHQQFTEKWEKLNYQKQK